MSSLLESLRPALKRRPQVRDTIRIVRPDAIMVELDESRVSPSAAPGVASREPTSIWEIIQREAFRPDASILDRIRSAEVRLPPIRSLTLAAWTRECLRRSVIQPP